MSNTKSSGIGCGSVLFLIFLVLKLTHNIDWSWWWVFSPIWGSLVIALFVLIILVLFTDKS
jgi:hypothetical protein